MNLSYIFVFFITYRSKVNWSVYHNLAPFLKERGTKEGPYEKKKQQKQKGKCRVAPLFEPKVIIF